MAKKRKKRRKMTALQMKYFGPRRKKKAAARRRRNPAPKKIARKTAPIFYVMIAKKGEGPRMHFNGEKFTTNGKAMRFSTAHSAQLIGKILVRKFPILKAYRIEVEPLRGKSSGK